MVAAASRCGTSAAAEAAAPNRSRRLSGAVGYMPSRQGQSWSSEVDIWIAPPEMPNCTPIAVVFKNHKRVARNRFAGPHHCQPLQNGSLRNRHPEVGPVPDQPTPIQKSLLLLFFRKEDLPLTLRFTRLGSRCRIPRRHGNAMRCRSRTPNLELKRHGENSSAWGLRNFPKSAEQDLFRAGARKAVKGLQCPG